MTLLVLHLYLLKKNTWKQRFFFSNPTDLALMICIILSCMIQAATFKFTYPISLYVDIRLCFILFSEWNKFRWKFSINKTVKLKEKQFIKTSNKVIQKSNFDMNGEQLFLLIETVNQFTLEIYPKVYSFPF